MAYLPYGRTNHTITFLLHQHTLPLCVFDILDVKHLNIYTFKPSVFLCDADRQCRPRLDAAERGV